ncbi:MAG TPA: ABC transporter ATP-binding protein [Candidatus Binataceae bacterium]|nr:ABC transporter ATP-binding protein [Candidatus Binataceae bacterium]
MGVQPAVIEPLGARGDAPAPVPALEVEHLSFSYGKRRALDDVSFTIQPGEIFGFLGPNGGGKTTLFRILSTLAMAQSGTVRVFGHDLGGATIEVRRRLGVVFQHPSLDQKLTVAENLAHHGRLYGITGERLRSRSRLMLERMGVADRANDLVETLSGGLKRRVELAKALLPEPELLLLDEPSTGLDPAARREFHLNLAALCAAQQVTIVLTTHYMEEAERCDRIGILHQGRLVAMAPPGELKSRVGGDVIVIRTAAPDGLGRKLADRFGVNGVLVDGTVRIERPRGHELVREMVEQFGDEIESVTFGKPTLEDVFIHLTGQRFFGEAPRSDA